MCTRRTFDPAVLSIKVGNDSFETCGCFFLMATPRQQPPFEPIAVSAACPVLHVKVFTGVSSFL